VGLGVGVNVGRSHSESGIFFLWLLLWVPLFPAITGAVTKAFRWPLYVTMLSFASFLTAITVSASDRLGFFVLGGEPTQFALGAHGVALVLGLLATLIAQTYSWTPTQNRD
jgi:hypothetical protein